jgi:hypothetical protein
LDGGARRFGHYRRCRFDVARRLDAAMTHDPHCPPGIKPDPEKCPTCVTFRIVRQEERAAALIQIGMEAYARGREDAAVAVREFPVHSIPFLPSDSPLSMAVRVKQILSIAAMGVKPPDDPVPTE